MGRVGSVGVVGGTDGASARASRSFVPHSSTGAGGPGTREAIPAIELPKSSLAGSSGAAAAKQVGAAGDYFSSLGQSASGAPPKKYGLGGWSK